MTGGVRFHVFDIAGRYMYRLGSWMHHAGLTLCGWAGHLDATADSYAD